MKVIKLYKYTKDFAENKDVAKDLRENKIEPELRIGNNVTVDFDRVEFATQSFIHALISETIRVFGVEIIDKVKFKNCNEKVKPIIEIVIEYVQDGIFTDPSEK